jgi:hypothetical protein
MKKHIYNITITAFFLSFIAIVIISKKAGDFNNISHIVSINSGYVSEDENDSEDIVETDIFKPNENVNSFTIESGNQFYKEKEPINYAETESVENRISSIDNLSVSENAQENTIQQNESNFTNSANFSGSLDANLKTSIASNSGGPNANLGGNSYSAASNITDETNPIITTMPPDVGGPPAPGGGGGDPYAVPIDDYYGLFFLLFVVIIIGLFRIKKSKIAIV